MNRNHPNSDVNVIIDSYPSQFLSFMEDSHYFGGIRNFDGIVIAHHIVFFSLSFDVGDWNSIIDNSLFSHGIIINLLL